MRPEYLTINALQDAIGFMERPEHIVETLELRKQLKAALVAMQAEYGAERIHTSQPLAYAAYRRKLEVKPRHIADSA